MPSWITSTAERYSANSDFLRSSDADALIHFVGDSVPDEYRTEFLELQLVIFKPETVASGKIFEAVNILQMNGITLIKSGIAPRLDRSTYEHLYRYNIDIGNYKSILGRVWMSIRPYSIGPAVYALVTKNKLDDYKSSFEITAKLKGASLPKDCVPGTLRYQLGVVSRTMNLFHCSDDPFSSNREARLFFDEEYLRNILHDVAVFRASPNGLERQHRSVVENLVRWLGPNEGFETDGSLPYALLRTMRQLILNFRHEGLRDRLLTELTETSRSLPTDNFDQLRAVDQLFTRIAEMVQNSEQTGVMAYLVKQFSSLRSLEEAEFKSVLGTLEEIGSPVNRWDAIMMETNFCDQPGSLISILENTDAKGNRTQVLVSTRN